MEHFISAILRGEAFEWPSHWSAAEEARFLESTAHHRLQPLIAYGLERAGALGRWPPAVRNALAASVREHAVREAVLRAELRQVVAALAQSNLPALLMKGAAIAYTCYERPFLRPRLDTDLLIRRRDLDVVSHVMASLGYRQPARVAGELIMHQAHYVKTDELGFSHAYDFHWKIANPASFADTLAFDDVAGRGVEVPALGEHAHALGRVDALLMACVHRVAHHYDSADLLWLFDIHLLAEAMDDREFRDVTAAALRSGVAGVCARGLSLARQRFGTGVPAEALDVLGRAAPGEPTEAYLRRGLRPVDVLLINVRSLRTWKARWTLLREHLFPPAAYVHARYGSTSRLVLPALYAHRILVGAKKWFRKEDRGARTED